MTDDYVPIDCDVYERYELAIMHRETLFIRWRDTGGMTHLELLQPVDLRARDGEEFLHTRTADGAERILRLDSIVEVRERS
ncbi:MAG TPA: transcriptional antiterminator, Rof [Gammaproteobacteria bacterium]